jgi:hypothetical protein
MGNEISGRVTRPGGEPGDRQVGRRQLFALAAVLAATVLTAGAAIAGLLRQVSPAPVSPATVVQTVPAGQPRVEPGD